MTFGRIFRRAAGSTATRRIGPQSRSLSAVNTTPSIAPSRNLVDESYAPSDFIDSAVVYSNVITEDEEDLLVSALSSKLKRYV
jgi:hypothetical protein